MNVSQIVDEAVKAAGTELAACLDKCGEKTVIVPVVVVVVTGNKTIVDREWGKADE